jgi:hypothetical protein
VKTIFPLTALLSLVCAPLHGATTVWSTDLTFEEFAGLPGGFESGSPVLQSGSSAITARTYDVLSPGGISQVSGQGIFTTGQDGQVDISIRTRTLDQSSGRWTSVYAAKQPGGYRAGATIAQGTSRSGDWGLVAMEVSFAPGMVVTADQLALKFTSANGVTEAYEWTMITLGGVDDAPFSLSQLANYGATDYSNMGSSTYYNALGGVTGLPGTGQRLATGRSISQYLSGGAAAPVSGGLVQPGWLAVDDFNAWLYDGPEAEWDNPYAEEGTLDTNPLITGTSLGLAPEDRVTSFTVWMGFHDVGFDSDGDGFTATDGNPYVSFAGLSLGYTEPLLVPEASSAVLLALSLVCMQRRNRK